MTKAPHVERMENELAELQDKTIKLHAFMTGGELFDRLDRADQDLLRLQASAMGNYAMILSLRLERALT